MGVNAGGQPASVESNGDDSVAKRAFDVSIGVVLVLLTLPVMVACTIGAAIAHRANPFFVQTRVGRGGRPFRVVKIRTLPPEAPRYADKYAIGAIPIPRFTALLRQLHLDELPQLLLVVTGRMSLVGPRPEMQGLHDRLDADFAAERSSVRPGCTGLWQVGTGCQGLIGESPEFDQHYLRFGTFRLDLWILVRTVGMFTGRHRPLASITDIPAWTGAGLARPATATATGAVVLPDVDGTGTLIDLTELGLARADLLAGAVLADA
jgi:lipopolysaccharide/colanic/teichoic acid biosynthesis glycosyltransferase